MVTAVALVIGVRGSTCCNVFIVGTGAPGGVRLPWADVLWIAQRIAHRTHRLVTIRLFIDFLLRLFPLFHRRRRLTRGRRDTPKWGEFVGKSRRNAWWTQGMLYLLAMLPSPELL